MRVVAYINAVPDLSIYEFIKETAQKFKFDAGRCSWTNLTDVWYIRKEATLYVGEETEELKKLKELYTSTIAKIQEQREIQEVLLKEIFALPTNENKYVYSAEQMKKDILKIYNKDY